MNKKRQFDIDLKLEMFRKWTCLPRWIINAWGDDQAVGIENAITLDFEESIGSKNQSTLKCIALYWPYCVVFVPLIWVKSKASYYLTRAKKKE